MATTRECDEGEVLDPSGICVRGKPIAIPLSGVFGLFCLRPKDVNDLAYPLSELFKQWRHALFDLSAHAIELLGDRERRIRDDIV